MALVPRRITLILATLATLLVGFIAPATRARAADVTPPTPYSPASSTTAHIKDIVLKWTTVSGATQYQVQLSPDHQWTNNTVSLPANGVVVSPLFEMPVSLPNATYYWRVRAQVGGVWSPYSARRVFVKDWESPITILQEPSAADPTLTWAPVKEASLYLIRYCPGGCLTGTVGLQTGEVDCYTAQTSVTPYTNGLVIGSSEPAAGPGSGKCAGGSTLTLTESTGYGWELIAYDDSTADQVGGDTTPTVERDCGATGAKLCDIDRVFSSGEFLFDAPKAGALRGSQTVTGLTTTWHTSALPGTACGVDHACPMTPTFSWDPVPNANYYLVDIYRDPDLSNEYRQFGTSWPELTPAATMFDAQAGQPYYWTVTPGVCTVSDADPTCATGDVGNADCKADSTGTSKPTLGTDASDVKVNPPGPLGDQSMAGGTTGTVSLLGQQILPGACVIASAGTVDESSVAVGFGGLVTFTYHAPVSQTAQKVTFEVVNPDGGATNQSAPLTIVGGSLISLATTSQPATFSKRSGAVSLVSPANHAVVTGQSPTFSWSDYLATGADESFDARNYELQISQDRNFDTTVLDDKNIDLTQFTSPTASLNSGSYYWRVVALDETGLQLTWSAIRQVTVNAQAPTISFLSTNGASVDKALLIQTSAPLRNLTGQTLKVVPIGVPNANAVRGRLVEGASPTVYSFFPHGALATGGTYALRLTTPVYDSTGNSVVVSGSPIRMSLTASNRSTGWQYSRGWTRHAASGAMSGSYVQAKVGSIATLNVAGSEVTVYACKAPHMGLLTVTVAGHSYTLPESQGFTRCGIPIWHGALPVGIRTITLRVSSGTANFDEVTVDGGSAPTSGGTGTGGTGTGTGTPTATPTPPSNG